MDEIEAIERVTLAAVPPQRLQEWRGWLLPLDDGTVGRSHSAVPLRHEAPAAGSLGEIEGRYAAAGLPAILRLPEVPAFDAMRAGLRQRGWRSSKPTLVQIAELADAPPPPPAVPVALAAVPGDEWEQVFLGDGFDPVDGASRLAILRRGRASVFASVRQDGRTVAVGAACVGHGWCGVHGMRTAPAYRGRGLATAIMAAFARHARGAGVRRWFLQVESRNAGAQSVYARQGFATAWHYAYWQAP